MFHGSFNSQETSNSNDTGFHSFGCIQEDNALGEIQGKLFVGGLHVNTGTDSLHDYFSRFGRLVECEIMRDAKSKLSRGFAFITFDNPECVKLVLAIPHHYLDGKKIDPQPAVRNISPARSIHNVNKKVFVGGLNVHTTMESLTAYFVNHYGQIEDGILKRDYYKNQHRGFGFITFVDPAIADIVCAVRNHFIDSKWVECKKAQRKGFVTSDKDAGSYDRSLLDKMSKELLGGNLMTLSEETARAHVMVAKIVAMHGSMNGWAQKKMQAIEKSIDVPMDVSPYVSAVPLVPKDCQDVEMTEIKTPSVKIKQPSFRQRLAMKYKTLSIYS